MAPDIEGLIISAQARLEKAREIAAACRHDRDVHEPLMQGVFALEDVLFMLHQMAAKTREDLRPRIDPGRDESVDATRTPPRD